MPQNLCVANNDKCSGVIDTYRDKYNTKFTRIKSETLNFGKSGTIDDRIYSSFKDNDQALPYDSVSKSLHESFLSRKLKRLVNEWAKKEKTNIYEYCSKYVLIFENTEKERELFTLGKNNFLILKNQRPKRLNGIYYPRMFIERCLEDTKDDELEYFIKVYTKLFDHLEKQPKYIHVNNELVENDDDQFSVIIEVKY